MKKKLGLLVIPCLAFLSIGPVSSAGATTDPPAQATDTCFGKHPTIYKWTLEYKTRTLRGTPGDDVIIGSDAADNIYGNGGNDLICARGGNDMVIYSSVASVVRVDLGGGDDDMWAGDSNGATDIFGYGGPGNDSFWGTNGDGAFDGGVGNNGFYGAGGYTDCLSNGGFNVAYGCDHFSNQPYATTPPSNYVRGATPVATQPPITTNPTTVTTSPPVTTTSR